MLCTTLNLRHKLRSLDRYLLRDFCTRTGTKVLKSEVSNSTGSGAEMFACNTTAVSMVSTWLNGSLCC